jgi:hypothetical protein
MKASRILGAAAALVAAGAAVAPADAAFHLWRIKEIYSNVDGSVQFIEMFTTGAGEFFMNNHRITASSDGGPPVTFLFDHDLDLGQMTTTNKHILIATPAFADVAGAVTPDYDHLPANFFTPNAMSVTLNFEFGTDVVTFAGNLLPKNGLGSLTDQSPAGVTNLVAGPNSPTNFFGAAGSLASGDFDENGLVNSADLDRWKTNFGLAAGATHGQGNSDQDGDVDGRDFLVWQSQLPDAAGVAIPEPATRVLAGLTAGGLALALGRRRRRVA